MQPAAHLPPCVAQRAVPSWQRAAVPVLCAVPNNYFSRAWRFLSAAAALGAKQSKRSLARPRSLRHPADNMSGISQETAQKLFVEGAVLICLGVPVGTAFGLRARGSAVRDRLQASTTRRTWLAQTSWASR